MEYISLQEGRFVLKDIEFDSIYISELLNEFSSEEDDIEVVEVLYAKIDRLTIHLCLSDSNVPDNGTSLSSTMTMTNMYSLGSGITTNGTVALIASIELDGINIGLRPITNDKSTTRKKTIPREKKISNT